GGDAPLNYQWYFNSNSSSGQTDYTLALNSITTDQSGYYHVVAGSGSSFATSAVAFLTVNAVPLPPTITNQPQSQTIFVGDTASFVVTAGGSTPLSYQWRLFGTNISGAAAKNAGYSISNAATN